MRAFRFGVNLWSASNASDWTAKCRRVEELGYSAITVPDHLGNSLMAPFPELTSAAQVTTRVQLGTLVLNVPFYNPGLLAREIGTTATLTGGRFELGLGAGHMKSEFDDAGLPWWPARQRIDFLHSTIDELRERLGDLLPPLLIAGNSDGTLELAAEHAGIAGFAGLRQAPGEPPGTFHLASAAELDERVAFFAGHAGERDSGIERNMLVQHVEITDDPDAVLEHWAAQIPYLNLGLADLRDAPQLLIGTHERIIETLRARRERYGFSYVTVFEPFMETFAPIARELTGH